MSSSASDVHASTVDTAEHGKSDKPVYNSPQVSAVYGPRSGLATQKKQKLQVRHTMGDKERERSYTADPASPEKYDQTNVSTNDTKNKAFSSTNGTIYVPGGESAPAVAGAFGTNNSRMTNIELPPSLDLNAGSTNSKLSNNSQAFTPSKRTIPPPLVTNPYDVRGALSLREDPEPSNRVLSKL